MRTCQKILVLSAIVAVLGGAVLATAAGGNAGQSPDPKAILRDTTLVGSTVLDAKSQKLGEIKHVLLDPQTGRATFVVIEMAGGAEHAILVVPYAALKVAFSATDNRQSVTLNRQPEQLRSAPQIQDNRWELLQNAQFLDQVRNFYQVKAYYAARPIDNATMPPGIPAVPPSIPDAASVPPSLPAPCPLPQPNADSGWMPYLDGFYNE